MGRLLQPRVLLVLGGLLVVTIAFAAHFYIKLSAEIDARLQGNFFDNSVGIFTAPFEVRPGDKLPIEDLTGYLTAAGYQQRVSDGQEDYSGSFSTEGRLVEIRPGRLAMSQPDLRPVSIQIDSNQRIASIRNPQTGKALPSARIEGELLTSVRDGDRRKKIQIQFSDIPLNLRNAVLAVEDRRFFSHSGIDWRGIARALWADLSQGSIVQGGSTITQQLVKNAFLSSDRTFGRKLKEASMAVILESRLSKQDIFTLYCNEVYLGQRGTFAIHGFAEAAEAYFSKCMKDLTLSECAYLAGLIHAPNRYRSERDPSIATERRNQVLDSMLAVGSIAPELAELASREPLEIKKPKPGSDYGTSYFIDYVQRYVEERNGAGGSSTKQRIYTTIDPRLQRAAYDAVNKRTQELDRIVGRSGSKKAKRKTASGSDVQEESGIQAALIAMDAHTGEILAMVGGRNYDESEFNRVTDAERQPGSTFKPFVYASALATRAYTPATLISDRPRSFSFDGGRAEYKPSNYHGAFTNRDVTLREALMRSLNVPTVELAMRVGLGSIASLAEDCGLDRPRAYPSMALGTSEVTLLDLAGAYTAFANEGLAVQPVPIKLTGSASGRGATSRRVFSPQVAYIMTSLLRSVVDAGTGSGIRALGVKGAVAGKTGTSNDGWFVGYTPNMVCAVWVGFDDNKDTGLKSSESALPLWAEFMRQATELRPALGGSDFAQPGGVVRVEIDPETGYLAGPECQQKREELFLSGTEPYSICVHEVMDETDLVAEADDAVSSELDSQNGERLTITLEVCAETGLLASFNCPGVRKTFDYYEAPTAICSHESTQKTSGDDVGESAFDMSARSGTKEAITKAAPNKGIRPGGAVQKSGPVYQLRTRPW